MTKVFVQSILDCVTPEVTNLAGLFAGCLNSLSDSLFCNFLESIAFKKDKVVVHIAQFETNEYWSTTVKGILIKSKELLEVSSTTRAKNKSIEGLKAEIT